MNHVVKERQKKIPDFPLDAILPLPVMERIMAFFEIKPIQCRIFRLMKCVVIRDINFIFVLNNQFDIFTKFVDILFTEELKLIDNLFVEFLMNLALYPQGVNFLIENEKIPIP